MLEKSLRFDLFNDELYKSDTSELKLGLDNLYEFEWNDSNELVNGLDWDNIMSSDLYYAYDFTKINNHKNWIIDNNYYNLSSEDLYYNFTNKDSWRWSYFYGGNYSIENFTDLEILRENAKKTIVDGSYTWQNNAKRVIKISEKLIDLKNKYITDI